MAFIGGERRTPDWGFQAAFIPVEFHDNVLTAEDILRRLSGDHWDRAYWLVSSRDSVVVALCGSLSRAGRMSEALAYVPKSCTDLTAQYALRAVFRGDTSGGNTARLLELMRSDTDRPRQSADDQIVACCLTAEAHFLVGESARAAALYDAALTALEPLDRVDLQFGGPAVQEILRCLAVAGRLQDFDSVSRRAYVIDADALRALARAGYPPEALQRACRVDPVPAWESLAELMPTLEEAGWGSGLELLHNMASVPSWRSDAWENPLSDVFNEAALTLQ